MLFQPKRGVLTENAFSTLSLPAFEKNETNPNLVFCSLQTESPKHKCFNWLHDDIICFEHKTKSLECKKELF